MSRIAAKLPRQRLAQRGQVLLVVLALLGIGFGAALYAFISPANSTIQRDKTTVAALAQAKEALIGRAAADFNRPGSLPCPDTDNDGTAEIFTGFPANNCPSYIGRLPWRTLGLPDLRDSHGERLWYALSPLFRDYSGAGPLNSNSEGQIDIIGTAPASKVIAIVFAPGLVTGAQVRGTAANQNNVANYLEGGNETGITTNTFVTGQATNSFNDKLLPVTSDNLFPTVEMRVAREARSVLLAFYSANSFFPFANAYSDGSHQCTNNQLSGRIPRYFADQCKQVSAQTDWFGVAWPGWFFGNNWHHVMFYAVASKCAKPTSPACTASGGLLTVSTMPPPNSNIRTLLIAPGRALASQARPCAVITDCLEDAENTNGDSTYVQSVVSSTVNDRMVIVSP